MHIVKATHENFAQVKHITHQTISQIYPHYYPAGAVAYFLAHHSDAGIAKDIAGGCVFLLMNNETPVGTVTINGNEINRLFVLPEYQRMGYGRQLLRFAEERIADTYAEIELHSSLPAKCIYLNRGYKFIEAHQITTENGDVLCYDLLKKKIDSEK